MRLPVDRAAEEEGVAVGVYAREIVDVVIGEAHAGRHMVEEERRQRLVDVQPRDLAEARKARDGHIAELVDAPRLRRIAEAAQDAIVQDAAERLRLAALEVRQTLGKRLCERGALHQVKPLARHDVAVEIQPAALMVERTDRTDEEVAVDLGGKGVLLHRRIEVGVAPRSDRALQRLQRGQRLARRQLQRLDGAQCRRRLVDDERRARVLHRLRLEDAVAIAAPEAHERDDGMTFEALPAVVDAGAPMHVGSARTADVGARELARIVERLHEEGFRERRPVDVDERERVVEADAERRLLPLQFTSERLQTLVEAHIDAPRLQILRVQRHAHREDVFDHAARITLQQHARAPVRSVLVERRAALRTAELARIRHEHDAHVLANRLAHGGADIRQIEIRRDEAEDERHAVGQGGDGRKALPRDLAPVQVADGDVAALQRTVRRPRLCRTLLYLRQRLRIHTVAQRRTLISVLFSLQKIKQS